MANWFDRWKRKEKQWHFEQNDLSETTEAFTNPARGWYQIYTFLAEQELDFEELRWCLEPEDSLALVLIDIGSFRKTDLHRKVLERIRRIICFFAENRYDCIVRVVYDHEGKAFTREPADFAQVKMHMRQIGEVMAECSHSVFVFQGMLLGNWGEMHGSRLLDGDRMRQLAEILRMQKAERTFLAVRRPVYWRRLHEGQKPGALDCPDGMGLFDDGIFGSKSHLGTFAGTEPTGQAWDEPWQREQELAFEQELCRHAPNGGEAVYNYDFVKTLTPKKVIKDLQQMQITYLNRIHDTRILDLWKEWKYPGQGVWAGKSVFDYVGAHMGYRFLIRKVEISRMRNGSKEYRVEAEIENAGFAACYQEGEIWLEYVDWDGNCRTQILERQMKGWRSKEARKLSCAAKVSDGEICLFAKRKQDGAQIRFANQCNREGKAVVGYFSAKH